MWSLERTPSLPPHQRYSGPRTVSGSLLGVSCTSPSNCVAVGTSETVTCLSDDGCTEVVNVTVGERWDGSRWLLTRTPNPPGPGDNTRVLSAVSCAVGNACAAVGPATITGNATPVTLAERWDGGTWKLQSSPNGIGPASSQLGAISCASKNACLAVGWRAIISGTEFGESTLAEAWNGSHWSIQSVPNPAATTSSVLSGVSCTSTTSCMAVGTYTDRDKITRMLAERWNGTRWTIQSTPNATILGITHVSCTSMTFCAAVGSKPGAQTPDGLPTWHMLTVTWDGHIWSVQNTPDPPGGTLSVLGGVSCTSVSDCIAVGLSVGQNLYPKPTPYSTLVERWDGSAWIQQTAPNPSVGFTGLTSVVCKTSTACLAVGSFNNSADLSQTLAEASNGTAWTILPTPNPEDVSGLNAVSCTSPRACVAVGGFTAFNGSYGPSGTLIETWNGSAWRAQTFDYAAATQQGLSDVSCTSPTACTAIGPGTVIRGPGGVGVDIPLIERYS